MAISLTYVSSTSIAAAFNYSVSGYSLPGTTTTGWSGSEPSTGATWIQTRTETQYQSLYYSWSFSSGGGGTGSSGSHTFTGLTPGAENTVSARVSVSCQQRNVVYKRVNTRTWIPGTSATENSPATEGHWGSWTGWGSESVSSTGSWSNYAIGSEGPVSRTVYTKPSIFSWSGIVDFDADIYSNLPHEDWNDLCEKTRQRINWQNQTGTSNTSNANVIKDEIVSSNKYNLLAGYLKVNKIEPEAIIKANLFIALSNAVNA